MSETTGQKKSVARKKVRRSSIPIKARKNGRVPEPVIGKELSIRERLFASEYFANGFNGLQAAIAAGYSQNGAGQRANELLNRSEVKDVLSQMAENRLKRLSVDADWIIAETVDLYKKAKESDSYGPAANLLKMLGQEAGVFSEKKEVAHTVKIESLLEDAANNIIEVNSPPAQ